MNSATPNMPSARATISISSESSTKPKVKRCHPVAHIGANERQEQAEGAERSRATRSSRQD